MMNYKIEVMLQFPMMPYACRVEVSPRQLHFLDTNAERSFAPDGTVVYQPRKIWNRTRETQEETIQ